MLNTEEEYITSDDGNKATTVLYSKQTTILAVQVTTDQFDTTRFMQTMGPIWLCHLSNDHHLTGRRQ